MGDRVQCQVCAVQLPLPDGLGGAYSGPWRCSTCGGRHQISLSYGHLVSMSLEDRIHLEATGCPEPTRADVREAEAAFNAYAPRAAVVMMRRALQRACITAGANSGHTLHRQITYLHENQGLFDDHTVSIAQAVRHFGNYGAHPQDDLLDDITDKEAQRVLELGTELLVAMSRNGP